METNKPEETRPCPGLHNIPCGEPRKKAQAYCGAHSRQYQRERYQDLRQKAGGPEYQMRPNMRVDTREPRCHACGELSALRYSPDGLASMSSEPVCPRCFVLINQLREEFTLKTITKTIIYIDKHRAVLFDDTKVDQPFRNEVIKRLGEIRPKTTTEYLEHKAAITERLAEEIAAGRYIYDEQTGQLYSQGEHLFLRMERGEITDADLGL